MQYPACKLAAILFSSARPHGGWPAQCIHAARGSDMMSWRDTAGRSMTRNLRTEGTRGVASHCRRGEGTCPGVQASVPTNNEQPFFPSFPSFPSLPPPPLFSHTRANMAEVGGGILMCCPSLLPSPSPPTELAQRVSRLGLRAWCHASLSCADARSSVVVQSRVGCRRGATQVGFFYFSVGWVGGRGQEA